MSAPRPIIPIRPVAAAADADFAVSMYEKQAKIYPRAVHGWFARWRWTMVWITQGIFYGLPWLQWNGRQAMLFDISQRRFFVFGLVLQPQDLIYLAALLIISALVLFFFTAVAGRLWCGYSCPQTVYTEIFMWIERKVEGDRGARMKLDKGATDARKIRLKATKHALWIALALWTGFTFVGYFTPIKTLWGEVWSASLGGWQTFWILFYGFATYGNAGWMREQVCKYMCPYARFQSVMFDQDTLIITYDGSRGEPRGPRNKSVDYKARGLGDCVDCGICVQVCPTGIDIRNGLQYECIGCGACVDGCNQVMAKMGYPKGLIRYSTENALRKHLDSGQIARRMVRPRVLIYTSILLVVTIAAAFTLVERKPVKVDVVRDRGLMSRTDSEEVQNVYRLQLMNTQEKATRFTISVSGIEDAELKIEPQPILVGAASAKWVPVRVEASREHLKQGSNRIEFNIVATPEGGGEGIHLTEKSTFVVQ